MRDPRQRLQDGLLQHQQGNLAVAERCYREVLAQIPDHPTALHFLGLVRFQRGAHEEAYHLLSSALAGDPRNARYHISLALACQALGRLGEARRHLVTAVTLAPADPEARFQLANNCWAQGDPREAEAHYRKVLALAPRHAPALNNIGKIHQVDGDLTMARSCFEQAVDAAPDFADAHFNLGAVLREQGELRAARAAFDTVLRLEPRNAMALTNLGTLYKDEGRIEDALACYRRALEIDPGLIPARDNLLFVLSYHLQGSAEERLAAHREWERAYERAKQAHRFRHPRTKPERLRIGYVSPDFKHHAASHFIEPLLAGHDRAHVEIFCYAQVSEPDTVTERLQNYGDQWRFTTRWDDLALARQINEDGIHVLVDLAGHTAGNRLGAFAYKPAPLQITYLGYCATTGLSTMDYWLVDEVLLPPESPELSTEKPLRLPRCWIAYQPAAECPEPAVARGEGEAVTFASFNHLSKLTAEVVATWSRILLALPEAVLLIKNQQLADVALREELARRFAAHGIAPQRLRLEVASADYLNAYNDVDIALDPFPRTGGVTTADALWMGVPVITLAGRFVIERQGASMLAALGLDGELCATDIEDYVARAVSLARAPERRRTLHRELRRRMADSPLCDGRSLAATLENRYLTLWQCYIKKSSCY